MNHLLKLFLLYTLSSIALPSIALSFCKNCKHFIKNGAIQYGKCGFFPIKVKDNYLVTGIKSENDYFYCSTAREFDRMCGYEGKHYEGMN